MIGEETSSESKAIVGIDYCILQKDQVTSSVLYVDCISDEKLDSGLLADFTTEILSQVIRQQIAGNTVNTNNNIDFPSSLQKHCESRKLSVIIYVSELGRLFIIQQI